MSRELSDLLERVRRGDQDAASHLVRRYESAIRVAVRTHLSDPRLRRQFDSLDVCQSVLASFFLHFPGGAYDLHSPGQLLALLTKMARNKLNSRVRDQYRQRRDVRRTARMAVDEMHPVSDEPGPERGVDDRDLVEHALKLMAPEIRAIALRRMDGELWPKIAAAVGGTPESCRKQFERAVVPIAETLDVEE